jgi:hypothetical protein
VSEEVIDLAALDDRPGSLVAEPAAPEVPPPDAESPPAAEAEPKEAPSEEKGFDPSSVLSGLTPEQRAAVLDAMDLDEVTKHPKVSGKIGDLSAKQTAEKLAKLQAQAQGQSLETLAQQAREGRDPDKALEYVDAEAEIKKAEAHAAAWSEASETYEYLKADPRTAPLLEGITGKDYGALSGQNGTLAALMFESDMARNVRTALPEFEKAVRAQAETELTDRLTQEITARVEKRYETEVLPVRLKEMRAKVGLELPPPDTGSGAAPSGQADDEQDAVRRYADGRTTKAPPWILEAVGIKNR